MKLKNHLPIRAEMNFRTSGCPWKMASKEFVGISHWSQIEIRRSSLSPQRTGGRRM
jgi:hypothetical protein